MDCYSEVYYIIADSSKQTGKEVNVCHGGGGGGQLSWLKHLHLEKEVCEAAGGVTTVSTRSPSDAKQELRKDLVSTNDPARSTGAGTPAGGG